MDLSGFKYEDGKLFRFLAKKGWREVSSKVNHSEGYCQVGVGRTSRRYHRIVWELVYGPIPEGMQIDHIDGNRGNSTLDNLRLVPKRSNDMNKECHRNGKLVGCSFDKKSRRWYLRIQICKVNMTGSGYLTEQEAHEAYKEALGWTITAEEYYTKHPELREVA